MKNDDIIEDSELLINIKENIRYCKESKEKLVSRISEINEQLKNNLIDKKYYNNFFSERLDGKTRLEWLDFCNRYIEEKERAIEKHRKESIIGISENIRYCKDSRKQLIEDINIVNDNFESNLISKEEYDEFFSRRIDGRTRLEWLDFCNRYIESKGGLNEKKSEIKELSNNIRFCKKTKKTITQEIKELNENYENKAISREEYYAFLNKRTNGKTRLEWLDFCSRYIEGKGEAVNSYKKEAREQVYYNIKPIVTKSLLPALGILLAILFVYTLFLPSGPTGFAAITAEFNYTSNINLTVKDNYEYLWSAGDIGRLKSLSLDGSIVPNSLSKAQTISKDGYAKVYLEYENNSYLIFDSNRLSEAGIGKVTALAVSNETGNDNLNLPTEQSDGKSITIDIKGDTTKDTESILEFNISSIFSWDVDYSKLCTKWQVNDISLCYGSIDCCAFIGLESSGSWNDSLYISYGRYGAGLRNNIKAQLVYANYSIDIENPYSDIAYSGIKEVTAEFYEPALSFTDVCIDTCLLPGFNLTQYRLVFVVENATLIINNIRYSTEREINVSKNAPKFVKEIGNITIYKDEFLKINLSDYFYDEDGDKLTYTAHEADNISAIMMYNIVLLLPEYNFTGKRYMYFTAYDGYYNISSNVFSVEVIEKPLSPSEVNVSEQLVKPRIRINEPIRWMKRVNVSDSVINLSVDISSDALNVTVRDVKENRTISEDKLKVNDEGVIKNASAYRAEKRIEQIEKIEDSLESKKTEIIRKDPTAKAEIGSINRELLDLQNERNKLTGYAVVGKEKKGLLTRLFEWLLKTEITGYAVYDEAQLNTTSNTTSVIIGDIVDSVEIEYYTEAPVSEEENLSSGKRIVVSSGVHYEDILAYTYLDDVPQNNIRLYWLVNGSRVLIDNLNYYDENNNSLIDMIEWTIPSLSNQTYEVIIEISKAEHLDANRSLIADIYDYVKEKDGNWSPVISNKEYVRVTFKVPLDNTRDITLYARSNESAEIEVYAENNNTLITSFENVSSEDWYKVYLTNLNGSHDIFDLKVIGDAEFDYIVDPTNNPPNQPVLNSPANGTTGVSLSPSLNLTVTDPDANNMNITFWKTYASISVGGTHTCGIIANGSAMCWGAGTTGRLGYGGTAQQNNTVYVNSTNRFVSISAGRFTVLSHTCGIISNGSAMCWGSGTAGQLGDGLAVSSNNPVYVSSTNRFVAISAGGASTVGYSCGIISNGSAMCWGSGSNGRLGYGGTAQQNNPVYVNSTNRFVSISAGSTHTCGIIANGSAVCWGAGTVGQLGDGLDTSSNNTVYVNSTNQFVSISAGSSYTCGIISNGSAVCWGSGTNGRLGYGGTAEQDNPVYVNSTNQFVSISAGVNHACGIISNGSAMCWGAGTVGQLGDGLAASSNSPVYVNSTNQFVAISAGGASTTGHSCGIIANGSAMCWGLGSSGQLGDGLGVSSNNPVYVNSTDSWSSPVIGSSLNIASGSSASVTWGNLTNSTTYLWASTVSDGSLIVNSPIWSFTTDEGAAPSISIVYPANNTNSSNTGLNVNYTVSDANLQSCWYSNDTYSTNTSLSNCTNITNVTWSEGQHNVTVWANDSAGNLNSSSVRFTIDTTTPTVTIIYPINTTVYNINVTDFNFTVSDANLNKCWYQINNEANSTPVACANFTGLSGANDANTWTVWVNDTSGNMNSSTVTFYSTYISNCTNLTRANQTYILYNDASTTITCFNILANNITFDMNGFNITGDGGATDYGFYNRYYNYTTIKNGYIYGFGHGIYLWNNRNNSIMNITANSNTNGIYLTSSSNNNLNNITANLNSGYGIYLTSSSNNILSNIMVLNNITTNSNAYGVFISESSNNTLSNITANSHSGSGITISSSSNNNLTDITANSNYPYGIIIEGSNNTLTKTTANFNPYGIYISGSNNTLKNITASSNMYGIYGAFYTISDSLLSKNNRVVSIDSSANNFTSNQFLDNLYTFSSFSTPSQEGTVGNRIDFNFTMNYVNGSACSSCLYKLDLYPSEVSLVNSSNGENIIGNFTPTRVGIYSLKINITDENENSEIRNHVYIINATGSGLVNYYFRSAYPTHGQPTSYASNHDSGSLLFEKPSSPENRWCGEYLAFAVDKLPPYLFGIYKQINYSVWYEVHQLSAEDLEFEDPRPLYTGIERYVKADTLVDYNISLDDTTPIFRTFNFSVNWSNDYFWSWYLMAIKLYGLGPYIYSNQTDPSYANITYTYSNTPAIKEISNENIDLLSATMLSNTSDSANITLYGGGTTNISILMPDTSKSYYIDYDGISCSLNSNCTINANANGEVNLTLNLSSVHTLEIYNDTTSPTVTLIYPANGSNISSNSIALNASATDNLVTSLTYYWVINRTLNSTTVDSNSTFNASDGYYNLTLFVSDGANNGSSTIFFRLDTTAPVLTIISPIATQTASTTNFNISSNEALSWCGLSLDGAVNVSMALNSSLTGAGYTNSTMGDGSHTAVFSCNDAAGNRNSTSVSFYSDLAAITKCRILNQSNMVYTMNASITNNTLTAPCINITNQNITVDCNGLYISSDDTKSGVYSNQINTTIINCNISMSVSGGGYGIYLVGANNSYIFNNTLSNENYGLYLKSTSNTIIKNITANSNLAYGIYLQSSSNNRLNNITANSNSQRGVYLSSSSNNIISSVTTNSNDYGIRLSSSSNNDISSVTTNSNYGIYLESSSNNNNISSITANSNPYGVYLSSSSKNTIQNSTLNSNSIYAIYLSSSSNNSISTNLLNRNVGTVYMNKYTNNFTSNKFLDNMNTISEFLTASQERTTGDRIDFNFTMNYVNGSACSSCSYKLDLYPYETSFQNSSSGELIICNFTPTRVGIYSLKINITDENNNSEIRKYTYIINATGSGSVNYYFRSTNPIHGQPTNYGGTEDAGSLLFEKPSSPENRTCAIFVGFPADKLPDYLFGVYKQINYSVWYQTDGSGYAGVQRYVTTDLTKDYSTSISTTTKTFSTFNFSVNWTNDYFWTWYWMGIKLRGSDPYVYSNQTDPSYANITYTYSNTPAIKEISNENIDLLSATMLSNTSDSANITLYGGGTTNISILMPDTSKSYYIDYDGIPCPNSNCTINANANGEVNLTLNLSSIHTLEIYNDTTAPTINTVIITPTIGAAGTIFNITASVIDNLNVNTVTAYIQKPDENNTATVTLSLNNGLYNGTWNSSGKAEGTYVIDIIANDTSGNEKEKENGAVIALSANANNTFINSSVNLTIGIYIIINATNETDTWLNITPKANITASVAIAKYSDNIEAVEATSVSELGKYISIIVDNNTNNNVSFVEIRIYYTDDEVTAANLIESTLRIYKFNESSASWDLVSPSGVETTLNYVWGNVSSFSSFGVFGTTVSTTTTPTTITTTPSSRAGGVCTPKWNCTEWSECLPEGIQTRTCIRIGTCFMGKAPEEERNCTYIRQKPEETCFDEIKNQNEEGVDCGGICKPCKELPAPKEKAGWWKLITEFIIKEIKLLLVTFLAILALISIGYYEHRTDCSLKKNIIKFEELNKKEGKSIKDGNIKGAIEGYTQLREDYIRIAKKANFIRKWILYSAILSTYKKLKKIKKKLV